MPKDDKIKVKLLQAVNLTSAEAAGGSFWGLLFGTILLYPFLVTVIEAGAGAIFGKLSNVGIDDRFKKELAENFTPGALDTFCTYSQGHTEQGIERVKRFQT